LYNGAAGATRARYGASELRIAQITPFFAPVEGGVEKHVFELSSELVKRGHSVDVYTSNETRSPEKLQAYEEFERVRVHRYPTLASFGEFGKLWPGFAPEIMFQDYDVVHSHVYRHPHTDMSGIVSRLKSTRSVMTSHSPFHPAGTRGPMANALVQVYDRMVAPVSLLTFDWIVSLTLAEVEHLVALGARRERISVIPHAVSNENFVHANSSPFLNRFGLDDGDFALYLGRIHPTKGVDDLLAAFSEVASLAPSLKLVIAGPATSQTEQTFAQKLQDRSMKLGISNRVLFTGKLTEGEKLGALEACRFFVLPSFYEPYGIVLLEAAAHGKPLLSTMTDGPLSIVENGVSGLLVPPRDVRGLAACMGQLMVDDRMVESMSVNAREMALLHTWKRVVSQVEQTYSRPSRAS